MKSICIKGNMWNDRLQQSLSRFEAERGISGFRDTKTHMEAVEATASGLDAQKGQTLEDMSGMVQQLSVKIAERKSRLAPIIKELVSKYLGSFLMIQL